MSPLDVPEDGDYIIGRVIEVKDFGATLDLLEYTDQKAFVHISEVASGWVKYIRDFIREGQMVVAKVTKVKKGSKIIDASVRQVSGHRKKEKIREWKNEQRASKLLELVAKNIKIEKKTKNKKYIQSVACCLKILHGWKHHLVKLPCFFLTLRHGSFAN